MIFKPVFKIAKIHPEFVPSTIHFIHADVIVGQVDDDLVILYPIYRVCGDSSIVTYEYCDASGQCYCFTSSVDMPAVECGMPIVMYADDVTCTYHKDFKFLALDDNMQTERELEFNEIHGYVEHNLTRIKKANAELVSLDKPEFMKFVGKVPVSIEYEVHGLALIAACAEEKVRMAKNKETAENLSSGLSLVE